jgi:tetratricopeptide (TPR) repeat protein/O-antigen ligase
MQPVLLALVAVVPGFIDLASARVFEEPKALLVRAAAIMLLAMAAARGFHAWRDRSVWTHPIARAVLALTGAVVASSCFSLLPHVSWWGAYTRGHGALTWLALVVVFLAAAFFCDTPSRRHRLLIASAAGSLVPSTYALLQVAGADPIQWSWILPGRAGSTFGNPILLGGYLAAIVPLTAAAVVVLPNRTARIAAAVALVLQCSALMAAGSRGPLLGLAAAAVAGLVLSVWTFGARRRVMAAVGLCVAVAAAAISTQIDRAGSLFDATSGSGRVRLLIWDAGLEAVRSNAPRAALGFGPEMFRVAHAPHAAGELARLERSDAQPDRAHNDLIDALVTTGIAGAAALLALYGAVVLAGMRRLSRTVVPGDAVQDAVLTIGSLAAAAAHVVEVQIGIATVSSRLLLLTAAAFIVSQDRAAPARRPGVPARSRGVCSWRRAFVGAVSLAAIDAAVLTPARADWHAGAAAALERARNWPAASAAYRQAADLVDREERYLTDLARTLSEQGRLQEAQEALERAAAINPFEIDHPRNLARLSRTRAAHAREAAERARYHDAADSWYGRAVGVSARFPSVWVEWAVADVERRRFAEAATKLDRAEALDAQAANVWLVRAHVRAAAGDAEGALRAFERGLADDPRSVLALRGRAAMLLALGRREDSEKALDALEKVAPGDSVASQLRLKAR